MWQVLKYQEPIAKCFASDFDCAWCVEHCSCSFSFLVHSFSVSCRQTKFTSVQSLLMHFSRNFGDSNTIIYYIGLQGEFSKVEPQHGKVLRLVWFTISSSFAQGHRHGVTICTYEARANPADHKAGDVNLSGNIIS